MINYDETILQLFTVTLPSRKKFDIQQTSFGTFAFVQHAKANAQLKVKAKYLLTLLLIVAIL
jgi:hypothetical protein